MNIMVILKTFPLFWRIYFGLLLGVFACSICLVAYALATNHGVDSGLVALAAITYLFFFGMWVGLSFLLYGLGTRYGFFRKILVVLIIAGMILAIGAVLRHLYLQHEYQTYLQHERQTKYQPLIWQ